MTTVDVLEKLRTAVETAPGLQLFAVRTDAPKDTRGFPLDMLRRVDVLDLIDVAIAELPTRSVEPILDAPKGDNYG